MAGSTITAMVEAISHDGQPIEEEWPYSRVLPDDLSNWRPPSTITTIYKRAGFIDTISIDAIIDFLEKERPVILAMMLADSFFAPADHGIVDNVAGQPTTDPRRHAVIALGHGTIGKQRSILVRNSWGPRWGDGGHAWLTEGFLEPRLLKLILMEEDRNAPLNRAAA